MAGSVSRGKSIPLTRLELSKLERGEVLIATVDGMDVELSSAAAPPISATHERDRSRVRRIFERSPDAT
jgi:hypothetical protein